MRTLSWYVSVICSVFMLSGCAPEVQRFAGDSPKLGSQVGVREAGAIKAKAQPGFLVFGPYVTLEPGIYKLVAKGNLAGPNKGLGTIDVVSGKAENIIAIKPIVAGQAGAGNIVSLAFEVAQTVTDAEFRINVPAQTTGEFAAYELSKID